ncbi:uncharacterized protein LOC113239143 [Hyposmocoma kahamanoa]|uniref:uncharacterized protein LOC113239143 n=1 Tax=Hyposmocoma kahamanoa TaxID=1477025 RepID=UPI000E6D8ED8|nr:uncharacterized protein LOC113239143 [Hyposmocoma kahamanoa]
MPITRRMRATVTEQPNENAGPSIATEKGVSSGTNSSATTAVTATEVMNTTESTGLPLTAPRDNDRTTAAGERNTETSLHAPTVLGGARLPPPPASTTTKKSSRSARIAKEREKLLHLQVQLAAARIARIETEDSDTDEDIAESEPQRRVSEWLDDKHACFACDVETREKTGPLTQLRPSLQQKHEQYWPTAPHPAPTTRIVQKNEDIPHEQKIAVKTEAITVIELAKAIAIAGRGRQHSIELPIYSGSHVEWLSFKAAYDETASSYSEVENIARLRRSLRGNAKEAVEKLLIYSANTTDIMKTLEFRFGRPDAIALAELEQLRALARPTDSPKDICIFATKVGNIVATLRALRIQYYLYNPEVTKTTIEKLTPSMRYRWYDFAAEQPTEEADLLKLTRFLDREAIRCGPYAQPEGASAATANFTQPQRFTTGGRKPVQKIYTTTEQSTCTLCNSTEHEAASCSRFLEADSDERWNIAKAKNLCFRCLKYRSKKHGCKRICCGTDGCTRCHHNLLHFTKKEKEDGEPRTEKVASTWTTAGRSTYLKMVPIRVCGPKRNVNTFALLDDGSTVTLVDADLATETGVKGPIEPLHIEAIANEQMSSPTSQRVTLHIEGAPRTVKIQARTIKNLHISPQRITEKDLDNCKHFDGLIDQLRYDEAKPRILIGQDNWELLIASETRRGAPHLPVASLTPLGWVLHGARTRILGQRVHYVNHLASTEDNIDAQLKQYFSIESLTTAPRRPTSDPEQRALDLLNARTTQLPNGRYETGLLWRDEDIDMKNNYENAYKRLLSIEKKIDRDPQLQQKYEEQMEALITKGYAEIAPAQKHRKKTWYLPHFSVINPMKPGKVRVVHDAAAKTKGISLNDHLLTGPDLLQSLPGVLMRLRQHRTATRDVPVPFDASHRWFQGPSFLRDDPSAARRKKKQTTNEQPRRQKLILIGAASTNTHPYNVHRHNYAALLHRRHSTNS